MTISIQNLTLSNVGEFSSAQLVGMIEESIKADSITTYGRVVALRSIKADKDYGFKASEFATKIGKAKSTVSLWLALVPVVDHKIDHMNPNWNAIQQNIGSTPELRALFSADKRPTNKAVAECIAKFGKDAKKAAALAAAGTGGNGSVTEPEAQVPTLVVEEATADLVARFLADARLVANAVKTDKVDATNLGRLEIATATLAKALGATFAVAERVA